MGMECTYTCLEISSMWLCIHTQALQCDDAIMVNTDSYMNEYHNNVTTLHTGEFNFIVVYEISQFCEFVGYVL